MHNPNQNGPILQNTPPHREANNWALLCHVSSFAGFIIPFGHIIAPLILWIIKRDEFEFVNDNGREAVNFNISMTIYFFAASILTVVFIGFVLLGFLLIFYLVVVIIATVRAYDGKTYRYPFIMRFVNGGN